MSLQLGNGVGGRLGGRTALGAIRTGIGVVMVAQPSLLPRILGADRVTAERVSWLTRMVGIREIAIGSGTVAAPGRGWILAGIASDIGDGLSVASAVRARHVNRVTGAGTVLAAAVGIAMGVAEVAARKPPLVASHPV